jgi:hypothetical protein
MKCWVARLFLSNDVDKEVCSLDLASHVPVQMEHQVPEQKAA